jgi:hypothetical protein
VALQLEGRRRRPRRPGSQIIDYRRKGWRVYLAEGLDNSHSREAWRLFAAKSIRSCACFLCWPWETCVWTRSAPKFSRRSSPLFRQGWRGRRHALKYTQVEVRQREKTYRPPSGSRTPLFPVNAFGRATNHSPNPTFSNGVRSVELTKRAPSRLAIKQIFCELTEISCVPCPTVQSSHILPDN